MQSCNHAIMQSNDTAAFELGHTTLVRFILAAVEHQLTEGIGVRLWS